jgi:hypothetical protein
MVKNPKYRRAILALEKRDDFDDLDGDMDPVNLKGLVGLD